MGYALRGTASLTPLTEPDVVPQIFSDGWSSYVVGDMTHLTYWASRPEANDMGIVEMTRVVVAKLVVPNAIMAACREQIRRANNPLVAINTDAWRGDLSRA